MQSPDNIIKNLTSTWPQKGFIPSRKCFCPTSYILGGERHRKQKQGLGILIFNLRFRYPRDKGRPFTGVVVRRLHGNASHSGPLVGAWRLVESYASHRIGTNRDSASSSSKLLAWLQSQIALATGDMAVAFELRRWFPPLLLLQLGDGRRRRVAGELKTSKNASWWMAFM